MTRDLRHQALLGKMLGIVGQLAREQGCADGFRAVVNTGRVGRQEVYHLHIHVLGGPQPVGGGRWLAETIAGGKSAAGKSVFRESSNGFDERLALADRAGDHPAGVRNQEIAQYRLRSRRCGQGLQAGGPRRIGRGQDCRRYRRRRRSTSTPGTSPERPSPCRRAVAAAAAAPASLPIPTQSAPRPVRSPAGPDRATFDFSGPIAATCSTSASPR